MRCENPTTGSNVLMTDILIPKVTVKVVLCLTKHHPMKTNWGSGGIKEDENENWCVQERSAKNNGTKGNEVT
jgi:hypothetical protein